jgi:hypothetical protein
MQLKLNSHYKQLVNNGFIYFILNYFEDTIFQQSLYIHKMTTYMKNRSLCKTH